MILIALAIYKLPISAGLVTTVTILGGIVYYSVHSYTANLVLLDATFPVLSGFLIFTQSAFNNFYKQYKLRQQIKGQFGTYISPEYVDMLVKDPSLMKLGGERKEMSFMFADIVGFTPISEKYMKEDDPEGLVELINSFLDKMTKIVLKNGGTIDKFMGDCIMAFWNAPLPCENHAEMAVKTAMEIDQRWVIEHAADRQEYIDQSQSLNVFFRPDANISYLHAVHFLAWKKQLKTMYYCRSEKIGKADRVSKRIERQIIQEIDMTAIAAGEECLACEG